ncbi:hypothetical protein ABT117_29885 [Streptomyces sp. NPDC002262]|uniref:hypothetical protein n=1 Tax=Streptomyces sp. NPDC002262 TaxID=3154414 RepID=UPI0033295580
MSTRGITPGRAWLPAVVGCVLLAGCAQEAAPRGRTERETADAYVRALNARDVDALVRLGPPGYEEVEADAREVIAAEGGRGLEVDGVEVSHEFGDDMASTRLTGEARDGCGFTTYVQMSRHDGTWAVVLGHAPGAGGGGASPAATRTP